MSQTPEDRISVKELTRRMSRDLLALPPGTFLGVELDVLERYQTSRPTLRQAARVLEHQQLLVVKAGAHGGYFVGRPSGSDLVSAAVLYLQSRGFEFANNVFASQSIMNTIVSLAARSENEALRAALRAERDRYAAADLAKLSTRLFMEAEIAISRAVAQLAGNAAFELFLGILYEFGAEDIHNRTFQGRPDRIARVQEQRLGLVDAILAHDLEIANVLSIRLGQNIQAWIAADADNAKGRQPSMPIKPAKRQRLPRAG